MDAADLTDSQDFEEPIELEEVQEKCYNEQYITRFFQRLSHPTHEDGYRYIVKIFKKVRKTFKHLYCDERRQQDWKFLEAIRKRASSSYDLTFSQQSSGTKPLTDSPLDDMKQLEGVSPRVWSSSTYSVPEMTDTPNTGNSSNDARDNNYAVTPAFSSHPTTAPSELPEIVTLPSGLFGQSSEDPLYQQQHEGMKHSGIRPLQEQVPIQGGVLKSSFQQDNSASGFCHHHNRVETYCKECAEELAPFFAPGHFGAYSGEHFTGEDGGTMDQDQVIWAQTALGS